MTDILRIKYKYNDLEATQKLSHPTLAQDIALIQKSMKAWSDEDQAQAKEFLNDLANDIQSQIATLEDELKDKPQVMDNIKKTMEACLAYSNTPSNKE